MPVMSMSKKEFDRLEVLTGVQAGRIRVADACKLLGLQRRQIFRLLAGLKRGGAVSLISRRRGKPSNNRLPEPFRDLALSLVRERYADFGPTLAAEKLAELHGCAISRETLRQWMIAVGLWLDRRHRLPSPHQPRRRRDCLGELVQIDGSEHAWFEDRGPVCTLLAFIDDADQPDHATALRCLGIGIRRISVRRATICRVCCAAFRLRVSRSKFRAQLRPEHRDGAGRTVPYGWSASAQCRRS